MVVEAPPEAVFDRLDDHASLAAHMTQPSLMMGGGRMLYDLDEGQGRTIGSHIRMSGQVFGARLYVDEVVAARERPSAKRWETTGATRLLVLSGYRMGFDITPLGSRSRLTIWIDYDLPGGAFGVLAWPLAKLYAAWCISLMASDAVEHFEAVS